MSAAERRFAVNDRVLVMVPPNQGPSYIGIVEGQAASGMYEISPRIVTSAGYEFGKRTGGHFAAEHEMILLTAEQSTAVLRLLPHHCWLISSIRIAGAYVVWVVRPEGEVAQVATISEFSAGAHLAQRLDQLHA